MCPVRCVTYVSGRSDLCCRLISHNTTAAISPSGITIDSERLSVATGSPFEVSARSSIDGSVPCSAPMEPDSQTSAPIPGGPLGVQLVEAETAVEQAARLICCALSAVILQSGLLLGSVFAEAHDHTRSATSARSVARLITTHLYFTSQLIGSGEPLERNAQPGTRRGVVDRHVWH